MVRVYEPHLSAIPHGLGAQIISPAHPWSLGPIIRQGTVSTVTGPAWPLANDAIYVPFRVPVTVTVYKMGMGAGGTAGGNFDLGIYRADGTKLVSSGSTARVANSEVIVDVTNTTLQPGLYYLAMSADGTNSYIGYSCVHLVQAQGMGIKRQGTAFTLPATATFAAATSVVIPCLVAYLRPY